MMATVRSKNSLVAKHGNKAEQYFCQNLNVKHSLEAYFDKPIASIDTFEYKRKKTDILTKFADGSHSKLQLKNGAGNNRGWSADRRSVDTFPICDEGKTLLKNVCLKRDTYRPVVTNPPELIPTLLLGSDDEMKPDHFVHTEFDTDGTLKKLSIASAKKIIEALQAENYTELCPKRTCVHIGPNLYLQRKGGGSADSKPDDIQLKVKDFPKNTMVCIYDATAAVTAEPLPTGV